MVSKRALLTAIAGSLACLLAARADAALLVRGTGFVYDDVQDITWLADANVAATIGYSVTGRLTFNDAQGFAQSRAFGGYSDWRLPSMHCLGFDCTDNELAHLYSVSLGVTPGQPITSSNNPALGYFTNVQLDPYWLVGTNVAGVATGGNFDVRDGRTNAGPYVPEFYVWLVRDGDVLPVPEPSSYVLALAALAVLSAVRLHSRPSGPEG